MGTRLSTVVACAFWCGCFGDSPDEPTPVTGAPDAGGSGPLVLVSGRAGGEPLPPVVLDGGAQDASEAPAEDAATDAGTDVDASASCGEPCGEYEVCSMGGCATCTLLADTFERADGSVGSPDYPVAAFWEVVPVAGVEPAVFEVVDGALVRTNSGDSDGTLEIAVAPEDSVRVRYRSAQYLSIEWGQALITSGDGIVRVCMDGMCKGVTAGATGLHYYEAVVDSTAVTISMSANAYQSEGGDVIAEASMEAIEAVLSDRVVLSMPWASSTIAGLDELFIESYPCTF